MGYLMVEGGSHRGFTVPGIGRAKAERIWYRALTVYLTGQSQFIDSRNAMMLAAFDLYGDEEYVSTENAWAAVGVYPQSSVTVNISNRTYANESAFIRAVEAIRAGPAVTVTASADVTYNAYADAGRIVLLAGFRAQRGSGFRAYIGGGPPASREASSGPDVLVPSESKGVLAEGGEAAAVTAHVASESFVDGLGAPYPNPSQGTAVVPFEVSERSRVHIEVVDLLGRSVATLSDEEYEAGRHQATLDGSMLSSGLYVVRAMVSPSTGPPHYFARRIVLAK